MISSGLVVASHNVMHGRRLGALLGHYQRLRRSVGLHALCVQEDGDEDGSGVHHGDRIAAALGPRFRRLAEAGDPSMSIVYDHRALRCVEHRLIALPRLSRLSWLERRYIAGGVPDRRHAQLALFETVGGGDRIAVANFHLETAGRTNHRRAQLQAVADAVREMADGGGVVACGDTNTFTWRRAQQDAVLREVLAPLAALGVCDVGPCRPTHFFSRSDEPLLAHQLGVLLGRFGIDWPMRYDVVCTDLPVTWSGQTLTRASDHDLVWARVRVKAAAAGVTSARRAG